MYIYMYFSSVLGEHNTHIHTYAFDVCDIYTIDVYNRHKIFNGQCRRAVGVGGWRKEWMCVCVCVCVCVYVYVCMPVEVNETDEIHMNGSWRTWLTIHGHTHTHYEASTTQDSTSAYELKAVRVIHMNESWCTGLTSRGNTHDLQVMDDPGF